MVLELGRVVAADTCAALLKKSDVRESYLGLGRLNRLERRGALEAAQDLAMSTPADGDHTTPTRRLFRARCIEWAALPALRSKRRGLWAGVRLGAVTYEHARAIGLALLDMGLRARRGGSLCWPRTGPSGCTPTWARSARA